MIELNRSLKILNNQELMNIILEKSDNIVIGQGIKSKIVKDLQQYDTTEDTVWILQGDYSNIKNLWMIKEYIKTDKFRSSNYIENYKILDEINNWMCSINYDDELAEKINKIYYDISVQMFSDYSKLLKRLLNEIP